MTRLPKRKIRFDFFYKIVTITLMSELLTEKQMLSILWGMVAEHGSQKAVAEIIGIKPATLNDILHENRAISEKVAKRIGYVRKAVFEGINENE